jgi:hypothetical protein
MRFLPKKWFIKKMIIRRPLSSDELPVGFRWMGKRWSRIFVVSFIIFLGVLTYIDSLLLNAGVKIDFAIFDGGMIGLFWIGWVMLRRYKRDWFKD